jgi:hypothetical protein
VGHVVQAVHDSKTQRVAGHVLMAVLASRVDVDDLKLRLAEIHGFLRVCYRFAIAFKSGNEVRKKKTSSTQNFPPASSGFCGTLSEGNVPADGFSSRSAFPSENVPRRVMF